MDASCDVILSPTLNNMWQSLFHFILIHVCHFDETTNEKKYDELSGNKIFEHNCVCVCVSVCVCGLIFWDGKQAIKRIAEINIFWYLEHTSCNKMLQTIIWKKNIIYTKKLNDFGNTYFFCLFKSFSFEAHSLGDYKCCLFLLKKSLLIIFIIFLH